MLQNWLSASKIRPGLIDCLNKREKLNQIKEWQGRYTYKRTGREQVNAITLQEMKG